MKLEISSRRMLRRMRKLHTSSAVCGLVAALALLPVTNRVTSVSSASASVYPQPTLSAHIQPPAVFLARIIRLLSANRYAEAWTSLNPMQQAIASLQAYVACESQSQIPGRLVSLRVLDVRDGQVRVLPESTPVPSTAVTFALRITNTATAQQTVRIVLTAHAVHVDSHWTWILPPARLELYREGCGSTPAP